MRKVGRGVIQRGEVEDDRELEMNERRDRGWNQRGKNISIHCPWVLTAASYIYREMN